MENYIELMVLQRNIMLKINKDGNRFWFKNGKLHRKNGPAVEYIDGTKKWYKNGKLHRLDGPAIEWSDGTKLWYIKGTYYAKEKFNNVRNR